MPDKRTHRGPNPRDEKLFADSAIESLRLAVCDLSLLLTKGYAEKSSLKLVGDRYRLTERQRLAVLRNSCSDKQLENRKQHQVPIENAAGHDLVIDGFNLLITIESAISGGLIFKGRDGSFKDMASVHGTYRKVEETLSALNIIGEFAAEAGVKKSLWLLDSPVSNSGRLKKTILDLAEQNRFDWQVELLTNPDKRLIETEHLIATSDGVVLDHCKKWVNLAAEIILQKLKDTRIIDLGPTD